jgi:hypothetical protein
MRYEALGPKVDKPKFRRRLTGKLNTLQCTMPELTIRCQNSLLILALLHARASFPTALLEHLLKSFTLLTRERIYEATVFEQVESRCTNGQVRLHHRATRQ